jgi:hypothetical protein
MARDWRNERRRTESAKRPLGLSSKPGDQPPLNHPRRRWFLLLAERDAGRVERREERIESCHAT